MSEHYQHTVKLISDLIPYAMNARTHSDDQVNQIAASIKEFGFTNPVLIDEKGGIIAGHGRVIAAKKIGLNDAPCIIIEGLTEAQKKAYILADNQLPMNAGWDMDLLKLEIESLAEMDFDLDLLGFDESFLDELFPRDDFIDSPDSKYTDKVDGVTYTPTGPKPAIDELYNQAKYNELCESVFDSDLPDEEKKFLLQAAARHIVFDYQNIAEYYAHSSPACQKLMEESALVIIDFDRAIELGYSQLTQEINDIFDSEDQEAIDDEV